MRARIGPGLASLVVVTAFGLSARALAQDAPDEDSGGAPALPPPTLELEEQEPPPAEPAEEGPQILFRIRAGDTSQLEGEDGDDEPLPRDIPFQIPGDARVERGVGRDAVRPDEERGDPKPFVVGAGAAFARLLGNEPIDFVRFEERFEARIPDFPALRLGVGAAQLFNADNYALSGGARIGMGAFFCELGWMRCELVGTVQPGVIGSDLFGVQFDLHASLDARFDIERIVEVSISGGYSFVGSTSILHLGALVALTF